MGGERMNKKIRIALLAMGILGICLAFAAGAYAQPGATPPSGGTVVSPAPAAAMAPASKVDTGDTAWLLTSSALVLLMTPGLAFFYGVLVRRKNALATIMQSFIIIGIITIQWALWGYSLAFGPDIGGGLLGSLAWVGLNGVGLQPNPDYGATVPHQAYMVFQLMFAVITPALITGAFAERMSFKAFLIFTLLWATIVYDPIAHWVWSCTGIEGAP